MATEKFEKYLGGWEIKLASLLTKMKRAKNKEFVSDVKRLFRAMLGYFSHFVGCSRMTAKNNVIPYEHWRTNDMVRYTVTTASNQSYLVN